ncbi:MAG: heme NO-binding domain-containing protein [Myxococcota bacterium]
MRGIVFTEFLEMVEEQFSPETADHIIDRSELPSGGAYTALGTYAHEEMFALVEQLSSEVNISIPDLLRHFGSHLFGRFLDQYPHVFTGIQGAFPFLMRLEDHIHVEVRKLYPNAELPTFTYDDSVPGRLVMLYRSSRPLGDLAEGLIEGCLAHYNEPITLTREDLPDTTLTCVRFTLVRQPHRPEIPHE